MIGELLLRRFVSDSENTSDPQVRARYGLLEGWVSIALNLVVFVVKLVPGVMIGSISLVADAFHSLSDVITSAVVIWGFRIASKPSDREHPFGHGRIESVASLVIAVLLLLTAWEFGKASLRRLLEPRAVQASVGLILLLVVSIVLKEWLSRFSSELGRRIGSSALMGDSWHHRSDVYATAIVVVALIAAGWGVWWVDGLGGLLVSVIIAAAAVRLVRESVDPLIGEAPSPQVLEEIRRAALEVQGVDGVHEVIVHRYGQFVAASLHVEVAAAISIERGHEIAEEVEKRLSGGVTGAAVVHVDPVDRDHPLYAEVQRFLAATVPGISEAATIYDLRIVGSEECPFVIFDLQVDGDHGLAVMTALQRAVQERFPQVEKVGINLEPRYVY